MPTKTGSEALSVASARRRVSSGEARAIRLRARLSGPEVAAAIDVSVATLWRWENGQRSPRGAAAARYNDFLNDLARTSGGPDAA